jgi:phenylalanyl-tRNA synthetase beta chain
MTDMRPSLLPGLLAAAARNANRGRSDLTLGEVGQVFLSDAPEGQHTYATGIRTGTASLGGGGRHWRGGAEKTSVFDAKADLFAVLDALGIDAEKAQLVAAPPGWSHPGRGGQIQLGPKAIIGRFGEVHPEVLAEFDVADPVAAFEIDLDAIPEPRRKPTRTKPALKLFDLNPVERDFAFLLDRGTPAATVLRAARGADKALISDVSVFDVFEGKGVPEGKKSLAIAVTLQPQERTLTEEDIEKVSAAIVSAVGKATGGTLRA